MTKFYILILIIILDASFCWSQNIQKFEFEAGLGFTSPLGKYHDGKKMAGPDFSAEMRYNISSTKWDCGVLINVTTTVYRYDDMQSDWYWDQSNRSINIFGVGDYNFKQGEKVNPYVGIGLGLCLFDSINEVLYDNSGATIAFRPRIGIELFRHLRLGTFLSISRVGFNNWGLSIAAVIGVRTKN